MSAVVDDSSAAICKDCSESRMLSSRSVLYKAFSFAASLLCQTIPLARRTDSTAANVAGESSDDFIAAIVTRGALPIGAGCTPRDRIRDVRGNSERDISWGIVIAMQQTAGAMQRAYQVLLFYAYVNLEDPETVAHGVRVLAESLGLTGRVIVAYEGINATLEGTVDDTEQFARAVLLDDRFAGMQIKRSHGSGLSFPALSVKVRKEIVGTGFTKEEADPAVRTAPRLSASELRAWFSNNKDFTIVDMRNNYEFASGHFKNSVQPDISASRHLPLAMHNLEPLKEKTVVTVCTGGVRCEKMSAYLQSHGFTDVYQLDGGIHTYMEQFPGQDFQGTLYTFDRRLTMDFGGEREIIGQCHVCGATTEQYVDCAEDTCHYHFLACTQCSGADGRAFCSDACRDASL